MANWQRKLDLSDVWDRCPEEISLGKLGTVVAERLRNLKPFGIDSVDEEREEIADDFADLVNYEDIENSDFNEIMRRLYDWGDAALDDQWNGKKVCWIER